MHVGFNDAFVFVWVAQTKKRTFSKQSAIFNFEKIKDREENSRITTEVKSCLANRKVGKCSVLSKQDSPVLDPYFLSYPFGTLW